MASNYDHPEDYIAWFIKGDNLAIVTTKGSDSDTIHHREGDYKPIDEAVTNGVLVHYYAEPNAASGTPGATGIDASPDIDNTMHSSLVDYVKFRLYQDRAGTSPDGNVASVAMAMAKTHENKWNEAIRRFGMKKRDKTGGARRILPPDLR